MLAAMEGHCSVVRYLLKDGQAAAHLQDGKGLSALMLAVLSGRVECVKAILEAPDGRTGTEVEDRAEVGAGSRPGLELRDEEGFTALLHAASAGNSAALSLLLLEGADPAARNQEGEDARALATRKGHTEVLRTLIDFQ